MTAPNGALRAVIEKAKAETGLGLGGLTVMSINRDPYRLDTPANHIIGAWLAEHAERHEGDDPESTIHLRALHYKIVSSEVLKPDGEPYRNVDADWEWMEKAAKAARWLGYIPFDRIHDARNSEPIVSIWTPPDPTPYISTEVEVDIPEDVRPTVNVYDFRGTQPWKLVIFGEKTSPEPVVAPIAEHFGADLYLPSGDISDTLLHQIAKTGAEDGRPMVVLTLSDCDPSGYHMPITIGHKLRALRDSLYPELSFEVHRAALMPEQVRGHDLPSTPLKESESRADKWQEATGLKQTELDAVLALQPDLMRDILLGAVTPFFDSTLAQRVATARREWLSEAQAALVDQLDPQELLRIEREAEEKLAELREEIDAINDALQIDVDPETLPQIVIPEAEIDPPDGTPVTDSDWTFAEHIERLLRAKEYEEGDS